VLKRIRPLLWLSLLSFAGCVPAGGPAPAGMSERGNAPVVLRSPVLEGPVMVRESLAEFGPDSSAVLHIRSNSDKTSKVTQGLEIFFFTGRHPHAVAANIVSQVQPGAVADTVRGMKLTTQNIGAADSLVMYGFDLRARCSGSRSNGSTMIPLWVHAEDPLGGSRGLVSRPILVTAPHGLEKSFASHVAVTAEGPVHVTRGALRVYRDMPPREIDPDPIVPGSGAGDIVAEGRVMAKEGIGLPSLEDASALPGVLYFSEEDHSLRFRAPDGILYRVKLEKI